MWPPKSLYKMIRALCARLATHKSSAGTESSKTPAQTIPLRTTGNAAARRIDGSASSSHRTITRNTQVDLDAVSSGLASSPEHKGTSAKGSSPVAPPAVDPYTPWPLRLLPARHLVANDNRSTDQDDSTVLAGGHIKLLKREPSSAGKSTNLPSRCQDLESRLADLFANMFTSEELYRVLRRYNIALADALPPAAHTSRTDYAARAAEKLCDRGLVDQHLRAVLIEERPSPNCCDKIDRFFDDLDPAD